MNKIIDLEALVHENKVREQNKLAIFEAVLDNCYSQIKRYNKEIRARECNFTVPLLVPGKPPYDFDILLRYLLYHLNDNGFYTQFMPESHQIYISWKEEDIDIDKYEQRRDRIKNSQAKSVLFHKPTTIQVHGKPKNKVPITSAGNVYNDEFGPINREKHQNAKRLQQQREAEFKESIQNKKVQPKTFEDFMRHF